MERSWRRLGKFAALAAVVHLQLVAVVALVAYRFAPRASDLLAAQQAQQEDEPAAMISVDEESVRKMLEDAEPTRPTGQVVDLPRPRVEERPPDAKFVAEFDSRVERERKRPGDGAEGGGSVAQQATPAPPAASAGRLALRTPRMPPRQPEAPPPGWPDSPRAENPDLQVPPDGAPGSEPRPERSPPGTGPSPPPTVPSPSLTVTPQQIARALGGGTSDYLPDIDEGADTGLNARSWRYATFFNRVKAQIRSHWHAGREYQKRDPTGEIYGQGVRQTLLRLHLFPDGRLAEVTLERGAQLEFLDDAAVTAVRDAQPFANPPRELVDSSGFIRFRFGFFFEVSGAPRVKVYRYSGL